MEPSISTPVKTARKQVSLGWSLKRGQGEGLVKLGSDSPVFIDESPFKTIRRTTSPSTWKVFEADLETARQAHIRAEQAFI